MFIRELHSCTWYKCIYANTPNKTGFSQLMWHKYKDKFFIIPLSCFTFERAPHPTRVPGKVEMHTLPAVDFTQIQGLRIIFWCTSPNEGARKIRNARSPPLSLFLIDLRSFKCCQMHLATGGFVNLLKLTFTSAFKTYWIHIRFRYLFSSRTPDHNDVLEAK